LAKITWIFSGSLTASKNYFWKFFNNYFDCVNIIYE